jgi:hypothetical protein
MKQTFSTTKRFTSGLLEGITITETTAVSFEVGKEYTPCAGSSRYIILACTEVK